MNVRSELQTLLKESYNVINDLQRVAVMADVKKELARQSHQTLKKIDGLKGYLYEVVDSFELRAKNMVDTITSCKIKTLETHSDEVLQCLEYLTKMCVITEDLLKLQDDSESVTDFAPKLKQELSNGLKGCKELNLIDYDMFASLDLKFDTLWLFEKPFLTLISKSSQNQSESTLCTLGFENVKGANNLKNQVLEDKSDFDTDSDYLQHGFGNETKHKQYQKKVLSTIPEGAEEDMTTNLGNMELNDDIAKQLENELTITSPQLNSSKAKIVKSPVSSTLKSLDTQDKLLRGNVNNSACPDPPRASSVLQIRVPSTVNRDVVFGPGIKSEKNGGETLGSKLCLERDMEKLEIDSQKTALPDADEDDHLMKEVVSTESETIPNSQSIVEKSVDDMVLHTSQITLESGNVLENVSTEPIQSRRQPCNPEKSISSRPFSSVDQAPQNKGLKVTTLSKSCVKSTEEDQCHNQIFCYESIKPSNISFQTKKEKLSLGEEREEGFQRKKERLSVEEERGEGFQVKKERLSVGAERGDDQYKALYISNTSLDFKSSVGRIAKASISKEILPQFSGAGPVDMLFNIGSAVTRNRQGDAEINAVFIKKITGRTNTCFEFPIGCCLLKNGCLVVADTGNHVVKILQDDYMQTIIGKNDGVLFIRPSAVITDSNDNIYVKDDVCIQIFTPQGKHLKTIGKKIFKHPYGIALTNISQHGLTLFTLDATMGNPKLHRYLINQDRLQSCEYQPLVYYATQQSKLRFFAIHNDKILASDLGASTMYLTDLDGQCLGRFGCLGYQNGQFVEPSGVASDAVGNWLVADSRNNRIQVFNNRGKFLAPVKFSNPIRRPSGIHLTSDGTLYVVNYLDQCIKVYSLNNPT